MFYYQVGFNEVYKYPILKDGVIFSHEIVLGEMFNIHGHSHNLGFQNEKNFCVSVELIEYKPILLSDITKRDF
jgi:calcineurin-like phosphoesterase family protein